MQASPGRIYADMFLYEKLEEIIPQKEIKILDIGCGSGYIRKIFFELKYKVDYTGVDVKKHSDFEKYNQYTVVSKLIESKIEDFQTEEKFDLVFSLCALEHIENDKLVVAKSNELLKDNGIGIYFVPSKYSFLLYLKHGYRRYNPLRLKKLFGKNIRIYRLGGLFSFVFHFFLITIPKRIFKTTKIIELKIYPKIIKIVNMLDRILPIFSTIYIVTLNKNETA